MRGCFFSGPPDSARGWISRCSPETEYSRQGAVGPIISGRRTDLLDRLKKLSFLKGFVVRETFLKRFVWEYEYQTGAWDDINTPPSSILTDILDSHLDGGSCLDLGCGTGHTLSVLDRFTRYTGVDISRVAISRANGRFRRKRGARFIRSDIATFEVEGAYDVILFREVLYYFREEERLDILNRFGNCLTPTGVLIVQLYSVKEQQAIIEQIRANCRLLSEHIVQREDDNQSIVLVCRCDGEPGASPSGTSPSIASPTGTSRSGPSPSNVSHRRASP